MSVTWFSKTFKTSCLFSGLKLCGLHVSLQAVVKVCIVCTSCLNILLCLSSLCIWRIVGCFTNVIFLCTCCTLTKRVQKCQRISPTVGPRPHRVQLSNRTGSCLWRACCVLSVCDVWGLLCLQTRHGKDREAPSYAAFVWTGGEIGVWRWDPDQTIPPVADQVAGSSVLQAHSDIASISGSLTSMVCDRTDLWVHRIRAYYSVRRMEV